MRAAAAALLLGLLALGGCAPKPHQQVAAPTGQWISLLNGHDLTGWTAKIAGEPVNENYRDTYRFENGVLKVSYDKYDKFGDRFGSLFYNRKFSHYWIRAEYRFTGSLASGAPRWAYKNSGLQLHSQAPETMRKEQQFPVSVEFDIVGAHAIFNRPTGDVCQNGTQVLIAGQPVPGLCSKLSDITVHDDDGAWVTALAQVQGSSCVRQIVNGQLVVAYTDLKLDPKNADAQRLMATGAPLALDSGYISIQSNGHPIEFRRIEVLPLDENSPGNGVSVSQQCG